MSKTSDPYRNTIKRALEEKESIKKRKNFLENNSSEKTKGFFNQSVKLPEGVNNVVGLGIFTLLPYIVGIIFIFLIIAQANIEIYRKTDINSFFIAWTIGYELIAVILLLVIFSSAINFKKK